MTEQGGRFFIFGPFRLDIDQALAIIGDREPNNRLRRISIAGPAYDLDNKPGIDREYAMTTDLSVPLIAATFEGGGIQVIDGYHRFYRAYKEGVESLPLHVLSEAETRQIMT